MLSGVNNYKHPILAKPSGITLDVHRENVISECNLLLQSIPFVAKKYEEITPPPKKSTLKRYYNE